MSHDRQRGSQKSIQSTKNKVCTLHGGNGLLLLGTKNVYDVEEFEISGYIILIMKGNEAVKRTNRYWLNSEHSGYVLIIKGYQKLISFE